MKTFLKKWPLTTHDWKFHRNSKSRVGGIKCKQMQSFDTFLRIPSLSFHIWLQTLDLCAWILVLSAEIEVSEGHSEVQQTVMWETV